MTRDTQLVSRRGCGAAYLLHSQDPVSFSGGDRHDALMITLTLQEEQLREVARHFGVALDREQLMSRCPRCNVADFRRVPHGSVHGRVPERVLGLVDEFFECGGCFKVFWMVRWSNRVVVE